MVNKTVWVLMEVTEAWCRENLGQPVLIKMKCFNTGLTDIEVGNLMCSTLRDSGGLFDMGIQDVMSRRLLMTATCSNCKRPTNTFLSDYSTCTKTKKAGIITECYAAFVDEKWVKGCGYDKSPKRKRRIIDRILAN